MGTYRLPVPGRDRPGAQSRGSGTLLPKHLKNSGENGSPWGKRRLGITQTTDPPTHEPRRPRHDCFLMTLPVVTAPSGETQGCRRRAAQRGSLAEVTARSDQTESSGSRLPAQPPRCAPEGTEIPAEPPVDSGLQSPEWTAGRPGPATADSNRFQPAPRTRLCTQAPSTHHF